MDKIIEHKKTPLFYGCVVFMIPLTVTELQIIDIIGEDIEIRRFTEFWEITYKEIKNLKCWETNELLTALFALCDFNKIMTAKRLLGAKVLIDVSFHHYDDTFPALIFDGANMKIIHTLDADISIDPY